jgi:hypothetical protein
VFHVVGVFVVVLWSEAKKLAKQRSDADAKCPVAGLVLDVDDAKCWMSYHLPCTCWNGLPLRIGQFLGRRTAGVVTLDGFVADAKSLLAPF